ncbi:hypothetical protein ACFL4T_06810 [candidate division KSB1 bacterium]
MKAKVIFFVAAIAVIISCALQRAYIHTYTDPALSNTVIKRIAVFPIKNTWFAPSEARQINQKITSAIQELNPGISVLNPAESVRILNENDLVDDWGYFMNNFVSSGIPDSKVLSEIGKALEVDAILQGEVLNVFREDGFPGDAGRNGLTKVTVNFTLLGIDDARLLWEASSDGIKRTLTSIESAPPVIEAVDLAIGKIMENLPPL